MDAKCDKLQTGRRRAVRWIAAAIFLLIAAIAAGAQEQCLSPERIAELRSALEKGSDAGADTVLRDVILKMHAEMAGASKTRNAVQPVVDPSPERFGKMCELLRDKPWPTIKTVGPEAASAWIALVKNFFSVDLQRAVLPVINAGVDRGEINKDIELATLIDRLRVRLGMAQIFGTQAGPQDGFIVLWPMLSEERVHEWRAEYGLVPFKDNLRGIEIATRMPLIRSTVRPARLPESEAAAAAESGLLKPGEAEENVRVETAFVRLDATVFGTEADGLKAGDFRVFEDGVEQEITLFAAAETPVDIVLLLDVSESAAGKLGLIRRATRRLIEMKRDGDRVSLIAFSDIQDVVSPLESDKKRLLGRIGRIEGSGASYVWDSLKFAFGMLGRESAADRRKAVILMTDGADNALSYNRALGSRTLFADLIEEIRTGSTAVFPIYVDTERPSDAALYADARRTLKLMADESGGSFYVAEELADLSTVYERVLKDLGRLYTLGYEPKNSRRDGRWRALRVTLPGKPDLKIRTRPGYYAR